MKTNPRGTIIAIAVLFLLCCPVEVSFAQQYNRPALGRPDPRLLEKINRQVKDSKLQDLSARRDRFSLRHRSFDERLNRFDQKNRSLKLRAEIGKNRFNLNSFSTRMTSPRQGQFSLRTAGITKKHDTLKSTTGVFSRSKNKIEVFQEGKFSNRNSAIGRKLQNQRRQFTLPRFRLHDDTRNDRVFEG